jgi:hypothetical protein
MAGSNEIDAGAKAMHASDPRTKAISWNKADVQEQALYRILAAACLNAAERTVASSPDERSDIRDQP